MTKIILRKNEERRLLAGHQWVFSNEIERIADAEADVCIAAVYDWRGNFLGRGLYNKHSLIAYRHLTSKDEDIDGRFIFKRLSTANALRRKLRPDRSVYRLCNGEADLMPGLIIDKYDDKYSLQSFSAGMDLLAGEICDVLINQFKSSLIVEKNNNTMRTLDGAELREGILYSSSESNGAEFTAEIDGIKYSIDLMKGQKTGFYLDQCDNRKYLRSLIKEGDSVLDLFCNDGGFSLNAAAGGAGKIIAVDSSEACITNVKENFGLNGYELPQTHSADCFDFIDRLFQSPERFDVIVVDPPSFTKSRKSIPPAMKAYTELNYKCMRLLRPGGLLLTFSCSHHISEQAFEEMISKAGAKAGRTPQLFLKNTCSFDHPVLPQMPETSYLKGYFLKVI